MELSTRDELVLLLSEAWDIEHCFETSAHEAAKKYATTDIVKETMDRLIAESGGHKANVELIISKVKGPPIPLIKGVRKCSFNFDRTWDDEMMDEVARVEKKMANIYLRILEYLKKADTNDIIDLKDKPAITEMLNGMVKDESRHHDLAIECKSKL
ncbi:MAG: hypothetical protein WC375_03455 [Methanomassiliicoccales archaeon]|jgi:rubrerythrin